MSTTTELRQHIQKLAADSVSQITAGFMDLSALLRPPDDPPEAGKRVDKLFRSVLESHRQLANELNCLVERQEKTDRRIESLAEEKRRLEVLYASGILFSSETEMRSLMEKAIDTVIKELRADAGFIILTGKQGDPDAVFARNMDPDASPDARDMSMTVIRTTLASSKPTQLGPEADESLSRQHSVVRLGITSALCVPLLAKGRVLGAVYLDRRNREQPFVDTDLVFLLSFARQIVHGLQVSMEISTLEQKLVTEAVMKFDDLRREFRCGSIVGTSRKLFDVLKLASRLAPTDTSVVLLGENGTGKDLLAHAIHENSRRSGKPFVTINCGAIPADLLESELFGYESGAFTGAVKTKPGRLEMADSGTVFFDEIAEMSVNLQAKLLRMIQTKEVERLGGVHPRKIDVRILAATNRNLAEMIAAGSFREDLYYRLKVFELTIPPLRDRREDVFPLAEYFLRKFSAGDTPCVLSEEALQVLESYAWPGNIRELENVIQRAVVLAKGTTVEVADLPAELVASQAEEPQLRPGGTLLEAETEFRRMFIVRTLRRTKSNVEAAQMLGINRTHLYRLLSQLDIES